MKTLDQYEAERDDHVATEIQDLLKGDYSPLNPDNFEQYLRELVEDNELVKTMFRYAEAHSQQSEPHFMNLALLGESLIDGLHRYWKLQAALRADAKIPSAIDEMGDERGTRGCIGR
jgi:hypothetical protein